MRGSVGIQIQLHLDNSGTYRIGHYAMLASLAIEASMRSTRPWATEFVERLQADAQLTCRSILRPTIVIYARFASVVR
jgi:hypothetical protein